MKAIKGLRLEKTELTQEDQDRFWGYVRKGNPNECWEWRAFRMKNGYGQFRLRKRKLLPHRVAYVLRVGFVDSGLLVCHSCDNRSCCNPSHLWVGDDAENLKDMVLKGRSSTGDRNGSRTHPERLKRGEENPAAILDWCKVEQIRKLREDGSSINYLSEMFNVSKWCIWSVIKRRTWK